MTPCRALGHNWWVAQLTERLGILGGTFNPIHLAHLALAQEAWYRFELGRVMFVPAARNPLLAYILPSIILSLNGCLNLINLPGFFYDGIFGIMYSIFFVCVILFITYILSKLHIRLHL